MMNRLARWGLLVLALTLTACASTKDRMYALEASLNNYERAIRWGEFAQAARLHLPPPDDQQFAQLARLKDIRVSSYQVVASEFDGKGEQLSQTVEIRYYHAARPNELSLTDKQQWRFEQPIGQWVITSPFPEFAVR